MTKLEIINKYIGLFEEIIDNSPESLEADNFEDYKELVREHNKIAGRPYVPTGYFNLIEDIMNELPFE